MLYFETSFRNWWRSSTRIPMRNVSIRALSILVAFDASQYRQGEHAILRFGVSQLKSVVLAVIGGVAMVLVDAGIWPRSRRFRPLSHRPQPIVWAVFSKPPVLCVVISAY